MNSDLETVALVLGGTLLPQRKRHCQKGYCLHCSVAKYHNNSFCSAECCKAHKAGIPPEKQMIAKIIIAGTNESGNSDFFPLQIKCTKRQYDEGVHLEAAKEYVQERGLETPHVVFGEPFSTDLKFQFNWDNVEVYTIGLELDNGK